jgi:hypothetical protein
MRRAGLLVALLAAALAAPGPARAAEGSPGPYRTVRQSYDLGRETLLVQSREFRLHSLPTRLAGEITAPLGASGRRPVVVFLHGAHQSCEIPDAFVATQDWPCRPGFFDVESFRGYRYVARLLASYGFVVVSLDGNPVAPADGGVLTFPDGAPFTSRTWMDLRAKIVDAHLRRLARAVGGDRGEGVSFGLPLRGRLDLTRVGLVGHSRGGEGVVWASLLPGPHPYRLRAIFALAPVDFFRRVLPDLPFGVVLPACDGDVFDLEGGWFYDDARVRVRTSPLWQVVALGANHNFFNRVWEDELGFVPPPPEGEPPPSDPCAADQIGKTRLSREAQEAFAAAAMVPFMRAYVAIQAGESGSLLAPLGIGAALPREIAGAPVNVSYQPPTPERLDVIRPEPGSGLHRNRLGGRQRALDVEAFNLCTHDPGAFFRNQPGEIVGCGQSPALQAHAITELRVAWNRRSARIVSEIPAANGDLRGFAALSLRAVLDPADVRRNPPGSARPFSVALRDRLGNVAAVAVPRTHPAARYPVRGLAVLGTVRIPLSAFRGVDLGQVAAVEIRLDRAPRGRLLLTDLSFLR